MLFRVFNEVDIKGHCLPKTLYQCFPRLDFSCDLCAAVSIHANSAFVCFGSLAVLQMVRLFLFRLGSLLGLFGLLVWEAFYRPNGDSFTGKQNGGKQKQSLFIMSQGFIKQI